MNELMEEYVAQSEYNASESHTDRHNDSDSSDYTKGWEEHSDYSDHRDTMYDYDD